MTIRNTVEYKIFVKGQGSSRPQHLQFNEHWHRLLWFACPSTAVAMFASSMYHGGDLILVWELFFVPPLFRFQELWATCDNDLAHKVHGFRGFYWNLYSKLVSGHRSIWSHSILFGTPLRFCIGYWIPILLFVFAWNYDTVYGVSQGAIALTTGLSLITFPMFAARFIGFWFSACVLADICHLTLDLYNPLQWLVGKK